MKAKQPASDFLSSADLCDFLRLSRAGLAKLFEQPDFPKPFSMTGSIQGRRWAKAEITAWLAAKRET